MLFNIDNSLSPIHTQNEKRTLRFLFFHPSIVVAKNGKKGDKQKL